MMRIRHKIILKLGLLTVAVVAVYVITAEEWGGAVGEAHGEEARAEDTSLDESELESVLALPDVRSIENWPHGIRFAHWVNEADSSPKTFLGDWVLLLQEILPPGCNIVDIGAQVGDTALPLAVASRGGTVVAIEMGPPINMLRINQRLNRHLKLDVHHVAVSDKEGTVTYTSGNNLTENGGIPLGGLYEDESDQDQNGIEFRLYGIPSVRLVPFLLQHYSRKFVDNICLVKTDTEGHDLVILRDLEPWFRPKVLWVEWWRNFVFDQEYFKEKECSKGSQKLFNVGRGLGYNIYSTSLPLEPISCEGGHWQPDLLLLRQGYAVNSTAVISVFNQ